MGSWPRQKILKVVGNRNGEPILTKFGSIRRGTLGEFSRLVEKKKKNFKNV